MITIGTATLTVGGFALVAGARLAAEAMYFLSVKLKERQPLAAKVLTTTADITGLFGLRMPKLELWKQD